MKTRGTAKKEKRLHSRMVTLFYLIVFFFSLLAVRLFQVQIVEARRFKKLARMEHDEKIFIPAVRGNIYDRNGELWAMSLVGHSIAAFPSKIQNKEETAKKLSRILGTRPAHLVHLMAGPSPFVWIARKIDLDKVTRIKNLKLSGIEVIDEPTGKRFYPKGKLACHVLGYTGVDDQGLDGIELFYDKQLRGSPGYFVAETDGLGRILPEGIGKLVPASPGADVTLTLDETLQYVAERELEKGVRQSKAKGGSIVVMNPENGEILALANEPAFYGSRFGHYPSSVLRNHSISDLFEPGSTFKAILAAAALESGKVNLKEKFLSGPFLKVDGYKIRNAEDGYSLSSTSCDMEGIITNSLNVGAASIALKIGTSTFSEMIQRFGFFDKTGIDLPGEATALIPNPREWEKVNLATIGFGQGIAVTPIQLARSYAMIANGGYPIRPHLLKKISFGENEELENRVSRSVSPVISPQTDEALKYLLSQVVKKGTGTEAAVSKYTIAGKTGTAQISRKGGYAGGAYIASFVGFVPVEKPALLIFVKVDEPHFPYWGGTVAAPIFKAVAKEALWVLQIPPSRGMTRFGLWKVWGEEETLRARKLD